MRQKEIEVSYILGAFPAKIMYLQPTNWANAWDSRALVLSFLASKFQINISLDQSLGRSISHLFGNSVLGTNSMT